MNRTGGRDPTALPKNAIFQYVPAGKVVSSLAYCADFIGSLLTELGVDSCTFDESFGNRSIEDVEDRDRPILLHYAGYELPSWQRSWRGKKLLIYHNSLPPKFCQDKRSKESARTWRKLTGKYSDECDGAVGMSGTSVRELKQYGYKNTHLSPLTVDTLNNLSAPWPESYRRKLAKNLNTLFVGRVSKAKGQLELVQSFACYEKTHPIPRRLRLYMPGSLTDFRYKHLVGREGKLAGIAEQIQTGTAKYEQLIALYRSADVYVSLSKHEGFGMPLIEAAIFGVPVIAESAYAVPETMGKGGILFKKATPPQVAELIELILTQPQVRRKVLVAQKRNLARFRRENILPMLRKILASIGVRCPEPVTAAPKRSPALSVNFFGRGVKPLETALIGCGLREYRPTVEQAPPDLTINFADHCKAPMRGVVKLLYNGGSSADCEEKLLLDTQFDLVAQPTAAAAEVARADGIRLPVANVGFGVRRLSVTKDKRLLHFTADSRASGLDILLKTMALLDGYELTVVAAEPVFEEIKKTCNSGLDKNRVRVICEGDAIPPAFALVMPKRHNGFELPVADAMYSKMAVVSNSFGAMEEFLDDRTAHLTDYVLKPDKNGELKAETTPEELARAIAEVSEPRKNRERLKAAAKRISAAADGWENVAKRLKIEVRKLEKAPLLRPEPDLAWVFIEKNSYGRAIWDARPLSRRRQKIFAPSYHLAKILREEGIKNAALDYHPRVFSKTDVPRLIDGMGLTRIHLLSHGWNDGEHQVHRAYCVGYADKNRSHLPADDPELAALKLFNIIDGDAINDPP